MEAKLEDILAADCVVVIGAHPTRTHPVIGSYIMRAASRNKAQLVVIDPLRNPFTFRASVWLKPPEGKKELVIKALGRSILDHLPAGAAGGKGKYAAAFKEIDVKKASKDLGMDMHDLVKAGEILAGSKNGIIIYGSGILQYKDAELVATILNLAALIGEKPRVISLKRYGNSRGAWDLGLVNASGSVTADIARGKARGLYLLLADDLADSQALADSMKGVEFAVVQASYRSPVTEKADVVLPSLLWTESKGSYTTIDGINKKTSPMVKARAEIKTDADTLKEVARRLKK
jgi:predicted molibdopterin-dependent oxidoreductase YjgC